MRVVLLSRVDKDSSNIHQLKIGEHVVGRGPTLECTSKKVSRSHAVIHVSESEGVTLTAIHHNPCFYLSKETKHMTIIKNGTTVQLHNDDQIALLADEYWFKIEIVDVVDETSVDNNESVIKNNKRENPEHSWNEYNKRLKSETNVESKENLSNAGHSSIVNGDFEISLNLESNKNLPSTSNLNNIEECDARSESPDFLNSEFNLENDVNVPSENDIADFIVTKGEIPGTNDGASKDELLENENVPEKSLDEIDYNLLETLSDLNTNNLNTSNAKDENNTSNQEEKSLEKIESTYESNEYSKQLTSETIIKEEPGSDTEDNGQQNIVTQPIDELHNVYNTFKIKKEPEDATNSCDVKPNDSKVKKELDKDANEKVDCDKDKKDSSTDTSQPSTSSVCRERCWYGATCYRKNPDHKTQFSHPGDSDYGDLNQKPLCPFGSQCYRRNPRHYQQYEHSSPPSNTAPPGKKDTTNKPKRQKKPKPQKQVTPSDLEEDDYDYSDPFLNDDSSDEFQLSSEDDDDDEEDINRDQVEEENTQENKLLLKEAKKFTKDK